MDLLTEVLKERYVTVLYDESLQLGKIIWTEDKSLTIEQYQKPFQVLLDWSQGSKMVTLFLSDTRNQGVVSPENRKWFEYEMLPAAIKGGLKRAAVISGGNVFKRYYLNILLSAVNKFNLPFKICGDEASAMKFLTGKD
ncbi:hypothetical protein [Fulvivirga sediminis]|uniref:STAS/SEC14 domain-containing protein n=1 Tax=Fulvivirga sediminis TaxID=2803949 RepID=A0A937FAK0_9BACT|nr:hypothetical protein [Fulvivirga sediminis]MBL3657330.1 hypothetical protein [Fulvivirga sediminis]